MSDIPAKLGIIPSLLCTLSAHATLAQQTQDTSTTYGAIDHLLQCRKEYDLLASLANEGRLAEAVEVSVQLQGLLDAAPPALTEAEAFAHLKVRLIRYNAFCEPSNIWLFSSRLRSGP